MIDAQSVPAEIHDRENIARVVFSPLMVEEGDVSPSAFFLRDLKMPEDYVSVFRHDYIQPTIENVTMLHPPKGNSIYGYALLNVGFCRSVFYKEIMVDVLPHPNKSNPFHAGIHYSKSGNVIKGKCVDPDFLVVAGMLANNSELRSFRSTGH